MTVIEKRRCICGGTITIEETPKGDEKYKDFSYKETCSGCNRLRHGKINKLDYDRNKYRISAKTYVDNKDNLEYINNRINYYLKGYGNFDGVIFSKTSCGKIQVGCLHKEIEKHVFTDNFILESDCVKHLVENWIVKDNNKELEFYKTFFRNRKDTGWG